jgi:hypothetical protein
MAQPPPPSVVFDPSKMKQRATKITREVSYEHTPVELLKSNLSENTYVLGFDSTYWS